MNDKGLKQSPESMIGAHYCKTVCENGCSGMVNVESI